MSEAHLSPGLEKEGTEREGSVPACAHPGGLHSLPRAIFRPSDHPHGSTLRSPPEGEHHALSPLASLAEPLRSPRPCQPVTSAVSSGTSVPTHRTRKVVPTAPLGPLLIPATRSLGSSSPSCRHPLHTSALAFRPSDTSLDGRDTGWMPPQPRHLPRAPGLHPHHSCLRLWTEVCTALRIHGQKPHCRPLLQRRQLLKGSPHGLSKIS